MAVSRGVHWDSSDAPYSFFHYALNIRNFCGGPVAIEDASNQMYRLILHQQIPCLFFIEWFILTHRHPGWKRPKTSAGLNELKPVLGLPVDQYILDSIPASMRKMDPSEYYQKLGDVILKTTSKDELAGAKNTTRDGAVLAQFPFIYLTRQLPFYDSTSSQRTDRRQKTTQYSLIEWAAVFSTRLPLIRQEPVQDLRTLMRGAMLKHAPAPRHPVMMFPDEEAFQSMGLFNRATMELEGNDGMYVFDETVLGSLVGAYADKCLGEISTLLSTAMRTNAGRAAMDVKGTMDGPTQRAAVAFVDALYVNVARQVSRKRFPPEYTFVSGSDPDDMGLRPSRVWPGMEDDANVLSSAIDLPGEASNLNGRVRKINPDVQAEVSRIRAVQTHPLLGTN
ncbi:hypothetical protein BC834DRAFT_471556 [Gloeopeniophorella convolvens]|nr:hypothetical protein BC834DRAFT_471556 [Gloeopeniophorella convolvens]